MTNLTVGLEIEGHIIKDRIYDGEYHYDGSVDVGGSNNDCDCDGSCRDNCECYSYCECQDCIICDRCSEPTVDCCCEECMICVECDYPSDECDCDKRNTCREECAECEKTQAENDNRYMACEECIRKFVDDNHHYRCNVAGNQYTECNFDCACECQCRCDCSDGEGTDGEVVSYVLPENKVEDWLKRNEPAIERTNNTCGAHQHIGGMNNKEYSILMDYKFHEYLASELRDWGKENKIREGSAFWNRLAGHNTFCKDDFRPREQKLDRHKESSRYCFINYCWALHRTMEVRVLPAFQKPELRVKACNKVLEIVHTYLANNKPKIHSLEIKEVV